MISLLCIFDYWYDSLCRSFLFSDFWLSDILVANNSLSLQLAVKDKRFLADQESGEVKPKKEEAGSVTIAAAVGEKEVKGEGENEAVLVTKKLGSLPQQDDASTNKNIENKVNDDMMKDVDEDFGRAEEKNIESAVVVNEEVRIANIIFSRIQPV